MKICELCGHPNNDEARFCAGQIRDEVLRGVIRSCRHKLGGTQDTGCGCQTCNYTAAQRNEGNKSRFGLDGSLRVR